MDESSTGTLLTWSQIKGSDEILNSQPELKDLYNLITPEYAAHWKVIGTLLGIKKGILDGIERNFPNKVNWCCNELLETWLERDTNASWKKLIEVINSPAVTASITADTTAEVDFQQDHHQSSTDVAAEQQPSTKKQMLKSTGGQTILNKI